jgi:uncharacterized membrane protein (UPF0127 family)
MLRVVDESTGELVAGRVSVAANPWTRFRGLMLRKQIAAGEGLLIRPCGSIHMMFMRFPIDVVFIDANDRVTRVARSVPRWRGLAFGGRGAKAVIELPAASATNVQPGHQLALRPIE